MIKINEDLYIGNTGKQLKDIKAISTNVDGLLAKTINIQSPGLTYNKSVKFFTLPYSSGIHSYIITGVVTYSSSALYSNVMLLITQTGTNVRIDILAGNTSNKYTSDGVDLYVQNLQAQTNLYLYGVCVVLS